MHHITRRLSPSLIVSIAALCLAATGSAVAAGEIITRPDQIKDGVVTSTKIPPESVSNFRLRDPQLKVRVSEDGTTIGNGDGTATRVFGPGGAVQTGEYDVTFEAEVLNGGITGKTNDTLLSENCAITATARDSGQVLASVARTPGPNPNSVRVSTSFADSEGQRAVDAGFDIMASC